VGLGDGAVVLSFRGQVIRKNPAPAPNDSAGWGRIAAQVFESAYSVSPALQHAGQAALTQNFFDEVFSHLDAYSRYVPPTPAEAARDRLAIDASAGLNLIRRPGQGVLVADVVPTGPAEAADVRVGDRILSIDDESVAGKKLDDVLDALSGEEGEQVKLRLRSVDGQVREVTITLAPVPPETVFSSHVDHALMISITAFTANTAERLSQALEAGLLSHPTAVIVDLRGNRGGLVRQAVTAVALFAEKGVVASTSGRAPEASHDWRIEGGDLTSGLPVIVLQDGRTASAAEIMSAALADLGRAVVVGSSSLGKGLVQTLTRLPDGGELFLTWSRVLAPGGWPIQSLGVMPQVCTSISDDETYHELDMLNEGTDLLAKSLAQSRAAAAPLSAARAVEIRAACPSAAGKDLDMLAARYLIVHPQAYAAALLHLK